MQSNKLYIITYTVRENVYEPSYQHNDPGGYIMIEVTKHAFAHSEQELIKILTSPAYKNIRVYEANEVKASLNTTVSLSIN